MIKWAKELWDGTDELVHGLFYGIATWALVAILIFVLDKTGFIVH